MREHLQAWLEGQRHVIETVDNGASALELLKVYQFDVIILDWQLPRLSGIEVLRTMRADGNSTPVLMLTGKNTIDDKEIGFCSGSDDYLTKPFQMREVSLRVSALLKRQAPTLAGNYLQAKDLVLDRLSRQVTRAGKEIELRPLEFDLLEFFMRHPNQLFSLETLLDRLWPADKDISIDTVRKQLNRLRQKLESPQKKYFRNVHGRGYALEARPSGQE